MLYKYTDTRSCPFVQLRGRFVSACADDRRSHSRPARIRNSRSPDNRINTLFPSEKKVIIV